MELVSLDITNAPAGPGKWYSLSVLSLVAFVCYMDRMALAILLEPIKGELGLSDAELGLLTGIAFAALFAIFGFPLARLADTRSRVNVLAGCLTVWSVMTALTGVTRNFPQMFLARMGVGIGEAGCLPAAHSLLSDLFPRHKRALAVSILQCGAVLGTSVGLLMVGLLAQAYGWRVTLQIIGLCGIPLTLLTVITLREPARQTIDTPADKEPILTVLRALLNRRAYRHLIIAYGLTAICTAGITQWLPSFLTRSFGMGIAQVGAWAGAATGIGGVLGLLCGGFLTIRLVQRDQRWELWLPAAAFGLAGPLYGSIFLCSTPLAAVLCKALATFVAGVGGGVALAAMQAFAEPHRRAMAVATAMFCSSLLGSGLGPFLIGWSSDLLAPTFGKESLRYSLLLACSMLIWATIHFLFSARHSDNDRV